MSHKRAEETSLREGMNRRKILVVGRQNVFAEDALNYAIHLADRLAYDLLVLNVCQDLPRKSTLSCEVNSQKDFLQRAIAVGEAVRNRAARYGVHCDHAIGFGDPGGVVEELNHRVKRIEFVVTESEATKDEISRQVTIPVFDVVPNQWIEKGGKTMKNQQGIHGKKAIGKTAGYGMLTAGLYLAVFTNADAVMHSFTKGGLYAALPIATVFAFSFAHGAFASQLWSLLGIEARNRDRARQTETKVLRKEKRQRKRPRVYAYVNPFHRM